MNNVVKEGYQEGQTQTIYAVYMKLWNEMEDVHFDENMSPEVEDYINKHFNSSFTKNAEVKDSIVVESV